MNPLPVAVAVPVQFGAMGSTKAIENEVLGVYTVLSQLGKMEILDKKDNRGGGVCMCIAAARVPI